MQKCDEEMKSAEKTRNNVREVRECGVERVTLRKILIKRLAKSWHVPTTTSTPFGRLYSLKKGLETRVSPPRKKSNRKPSYIRKSSTA